MPEIFRKFGFRFFFYSDEHEPIHIHVSKGENEASYNVTETEINLRENYGMNNKELKKIEMLIVENRELIIESWDNYFIKNKGNDNKGTN